MMSTASASSRRYKEKSSSSTSASVAAKKRKPAAAEDEEVVYVGKLSDFDDTRPLTRAQSQRREAEQQKEVKLEYRNYKEGEVRCPVCSSRRFVWGGCKKMTCANASLHPSGGYVFFCGHCGLQSPHKEYYYADILTCKCQDSFCDEARLEEEGKTVELHEDGDEDEDTATQSQGRLVSESSEMGSDTDSTRNVSDTAMAATSEADNQDEEVAPEGHESPGSKEASSNIKQDPDAVPSAADHDKKVGDETDRPEKVKSAPIPVAIEIKSEASLSSLSAAALKTKEEWTDQAKEGESLTQDGDEAKEKSALKDVNAYHGASSQVNPNDDETDDEDSAQIRHHNNTSKKRALILKDTDGKAKKKHRKEGQKFIDLTDVPAQLPIMSNRKNGSSKYQGVCFDKTHNRWIAMIRIDGKQHHIGRYDDEEEAAIDYSRAVYKFRAGNTVDGTPQKGKKFIDLTDVPKKPPIISNTGGTSRYQGVHFHEANKKWLARIRIDGKLRHIGYYDDEEEAAVDYARAVFKYIAGNVKVARKQVKKLIDLTDVPEQLPIISNRGGASKYQGVCFDNSRNKWTAQIKIDGKKHHIGSYNDEEEAAVDYARALFKFKYIDR